MEMGNPTPDTKNVSAAPGSQTVQTGDPTTYALDTQKLLPPELLGTAYKLASAPAAPPPNYQFGGPKPAYLRFMDGVGPHPIIRWDHGSLDDGHNNLDVSKIREPTLSDKAHKIAWLVALGYFRGHRPDLWNMTEGYSHYHFGNGQTRSFTYDKYIVQDKSGWTLLRSAIEDTIAVASYLDMQKRVASDYTGNFDITSDAMSTANKRYPYPENEDWQKTIGGHCVWVTANVMVATDEAKTTRSFSVMMTLSAEDKYNFDPAKADIGTGIKDSENGRFQVCRLADEFLQVASSFRAFTYTAPLTWDERFFPQGLDLDAIIKPAPLADLWVGLAP
jgi:hypothetical protein